MYSESFTSVQRLNSVASIFTAELQGVLTTVDYIIESHTMKAVVFVDSQSVITAISSVKDSKHNLIQLVRAKINRGLQKGHDIIFCWVPSHVGLSGNEKADRLAASSKNLLETRLQLPHQDLKPIFRAAIFLKWQTEWDQQHDNKLHSIKPVLGIWESSSHKTRSREILLCRLRLGHSYVTHVYLLHGADPPFCEHCGEILTVWHILGLCSALAQERRSCFPEFSMYCIPFHPALVLGEQPIIPFERVVMFLEKTGFLHNF